MMSAYLDFGRDEEGGAGEEGSALEGAETQE